MKLQLPILVFMLLFCTAMTGQKILHKANKQFDLKHYHEAIDSYNKTLAKYPDNLEAKSNLAEAYRMTNQLTLAEQAYAQIMPEEFVDPIHIRNYGITLMKMAKYNKAHYQFELYKVYNPQDAQHYQLSCEFAHHLYRQEKAYDIELVGLNTPNSDFGVAFEGDKLIFSSFRNDVELSDDAKKSGQKLTGNMLYVAELTDDLRAEDVRFLRSGIAEKKNIGPISFATSKGICAFTRNKIQNGGAHVTGDDSYHSIYIADLKANGDWHNERPFRYNEFGTSTGFPSLAFDGSAIYFASNRVGGFGGYDLYVSYWKENSWTYPENLGSNINTPGNEITPYFNEGELYFASDYHHGMGGYDIFHSDVKGGAWSHPENLANGINSPADDYYPAIKEGTKGIFFSSNRLGGRGMDDVYLAMPSQSQEILANVDFMPEAVALTDIDSRVDAASTNPEAKAVANNESIEITVLNPVIEEDEKDKKAANEEVIKEEEELPLWGFAKPGEEKILKRESRSMITVAHIDVRAIDAIEFKYRNIPTNQNVSIPYQPEGSLLDQMILAMDTNYDVIEKVEAESAQTVPVSNDEIIASIVNETNMESATVEIINQETETSTQTKKAEQIITTESVDLEEEVTAVADVQKPESHKIPNYKAISASRAPLNLDLSGAKRVALGEILPASNVYFIQLAALSKSSGNVNKFKSLARFGNLYKVFKSSSTKIKLGYFLDRSEASNVLKSVKANGYKDAFITKDDLITLQLELIVANDNQSNSYTSYDSSSKATQSATSSVPTFDVNGDEYTLNNTAKNSYKIRLASYEDPIWFDIEKAKELGKIEQWTKGNWTIFILGGYNTYRDAEQAMIRAVNKGFADAEIVIDNNGILERLKEN